MHLSSSLLTHLNKKLLRFLGLFISLASPVFAGGVELTNFGHSSILIKGGGQSVLLNPFKSIGCAEGLKEPRMKVNVILASSQLADEGAKIAKGFYLFKPGSYSINGIKYEGFSVDHDRVGGRRFGQATLWQWKQAGLNFAHFGTGAELPSFEDKLLIGRPDVLILGVGGGLKAFDGEQAAKIVKDFKPKIVIPVQYLINRKLQNCDLSNIDNFLEIMKDYPVRRDGKVLSLPSNLKDETIISIMSVN